MRFPKWVKDIEFRSLLTKMLTKNPAKRLFKLDQVKHHPYFQDYKWEDLINLSIEVAWKVHVEELNIDYESYIDHMKVFEYKIEKPQ